jgi:glycosyltransferase involved in cell wall biosynthesis
MTASTLGNAKSTRASGAPQTSLPAALIYRDFLLPYSETFIHAQASALQKHRAVLVGRNRVSGIDLEDDAVEIVDTGGWTGRGRALRYRLGSVPPDFVARIRAREPVILHAHFGPDALNAHALQQKLAVPMLMTFHGYDATGATGLASGFHGYRYGRRRPLLAERAACILAVSDFIRDRLIALGIPDRLVRTHHIGVKTDRFTPTSRDSRSLTVLAVGRFVEKKGFEYLIDAMSIVQSQVPEAELVLIGDGPRRDELWQAARANLRRFRMPGPLSPGQVAQWMQQARVMAVPSVTARSGDTEGLPMTVAEALASGLPVVASAHAGIPEAVLDGQTGFLAPERNSEVLADRLIAVLSEDSLWDQLSVAAREHALEEFDLGRQTEVLEEIYAEFH